MSNDSEMTFEQKLEKVQLIASQLENGGLLLEESVKCYEEGIRLLNELETEMSNVQQRLTVLRTGNDGTVAEFAVEEDNP